MKLAKLAGTALLAAAAWAAEPYALIAGTVFRPAGNAFPGVEVQLAGDGKKPRRTKTDARGEFSFRVPAEEARYTVSVRPAGFQPQEKPVVIRSDERVDLSFLLEQSPR